MPVDFPGADPQRPGMANAPDPALAPVYHHWAAAPRSDPGLCHDARRTGYYRERVPKGTKLAFTPAWRRTFGVLGKAVGWSELETLATVANVRTFQRWYKLVQEAPAQLANTVGRPKVPDWVKVLVRTMAYTTTRGITRIAGAVANVWQKIHPKTVRRILREHHCDPTQRTLTRPESTWKPFITEEGHQIAAMEMRACP